MEFSAQNILSTIKSIFPHFLLNYIQKKISCEKIKGTYLTLSFCNFLEWLMAHTATQQNPKCPTDLFVLKALPLARPIIL